MSVDWLSRDELGLVAPNTERLSVRSNKIRGVVIHWVNDIPEPNDPSALWRQLQQEAMSGNNVNNTEYGDVEYNAAALASIAHPGNGTIFAGRDNSWTGAHATSAGNLANEVTLGLVVVGNVLDPGVIEAINAYLWVVKVGIVGTAVGQPFVLEGHQELVNVGGISTACPGAFEDFVVWQRAVLGASKL